MLWSGWALVIIGIAVAVVSLAHPGPVSAGSVAGSSSNESYSKLVDVGWVITVVGAIVLAASQIRRFSGPSGPSDEPAGDRR